MIKKSARIKADRIEGFFRELSSLIFQDLSEQAMKKLQTAINLTLTCDEADEAAVEDITKIFSEVYEEMTAETEKLDIYGTPVQSIAGEVRRVVVR